MMPFALSQVLFLVLGLLLGLLLMRAFGRPPTGGEATVRLVRTARTPDGREETRLYVNDIAILTATNDGVRLADYADEVEQLEAVAQRLASSLRVTVEFARVGPRAAAGVDGIPVRDLPAEHSSPSPDDDVEARRGRLDDRRAAR